MPLDDAIKMMIALFAGHHVLTTTSSEDNGSETLQNECKKPLEYKKLLRKGKELMVGISATSQYFVNLEMSYKWINEGFVCTIN